ncbi:MAG: S9 family peptidase [Chitinophagaceae bacterium]|nr:S9 family peptidase [Oligoflexus sp.]
MTTSTLGTAAPLKSDKDYDWLEDLHSDKSLGWVKEHNERSLNRLEKTTTYAKMKTDALGILQAKDKIAYGSIRKDFVYNFWQDADHVKGIWRRSPWSAYRDGKPQWDTLLDVDALAKSSGKNYVYGGVECLRKDENRCLVTLSEGGSDASFLGEFNLEKREFVAGGFELPASKSSVHWVNKDELLFNNALTAATQTDSGYALEVRRWKRGDKADKAPIVFRGEKSDVSVNGWVSHDENEDKEYVFYSRGLSFYTSELWVDKEGQPFKLPLPIDVEMKGLHKGQFLFSNRKQLGTFPAGSLISVPFAELLKGNTPYQLVFTPNSHQSLDTIEISKDFVYANLLDNVRSRVIRFELNGDKTSWTQKDLPLETTGSIALVSTDDTTNRMLIGYEDFLTPSSLYAMDGGTLEKHLITQLPPRFHTEGLMIAQEFATSTDGEKIPYFIIHAKSMKKDGKNPTLLYGYGGFEVSMHPSYLAVAGKLWLEKGGVYVLANIRGGGEFGPRWHQAALLEHRQKAFDDFAAVAKDLITKGITTPEHLGIQGGSNGGLLMGASFTQHPELYNAVVCQVPLLDMLRYHKLLAGASWMAEYGNPDDPKMRKVLEAYSPFQNLSPKKTYPEVFFVTSTADDRVHPGHARKMAARMEEYKKPFLYYENIEGGHSASADLQQRAKRSALEWSYLAQKLGLKS